MDVARGNGQRQSRRGVKAIMDRRLGNADTQHYVCVFETAIHAGLSRQ